MELFARIRRDARVKGLSIRALAREHPPVEAFVPQEHAPGAEAEVDFGDVWVDLAGVRTRCYMFAYRLSHSGKAVHRVYLTRGRRS